MKIKLYALSLLATVAMFGCSKYNDTELRGRIENLETWQKTVNDQIVSLQGLIGALENKDYVTSVTELSDKSGYVIAFSKSGSITIKHGQKGADATAPVVGVKKDTDGKYYWALNGEFITTGGSKIPTTGDKGETGNDAIAPKVRINPNTNEWEISIDGGTDYTSTGVKVTGAQGDAIFAADGIDLSDPDNVTFTLADGVTTITLPRTNSVIVGFESYETIEIIAGIDCNDINVIMPSTESYTSVMAKIESNGGTNIDVKTKASGSPWSAEIIKGADNKVSIKITPAVDAQNGDVAILTVSVVTKTGALVSASRTIKVTTPTPITPIGDTYTIGSASQLSWVMSQMSITDFTKGKTFELESNLDLSGYNWKPIGAQDDGTNIQFVGTFDGKGYTIKGLDIKRNQNRHVGFFSFVGETGTVKNINIEGTVTNTMYSTNASITISTGGVVGANMGAVINCSFKGNVSSNNVFHTGGVVGVNQEGLVAGCSYIGSEGAMVRANGREPGTSGHSGGVVGYNFANTKNAYILGCFNTGKVSAVGRCGGIVAESYGNGGAGAAIIIGCYNQGYVKSDNANVEVGGIAGTMGDYSQIIGCYNSGSVVSDNASNVNVCAIMGRDVFWKAEDQLNTNYWLTGSAPQGYSNVNEDQAVDCVEKSAVELNSQATVDALNAAIDAWNATNNDLCTYRYVVGSQYPMLISK